MMGWACALEGGERRNGYRIFIRKPLGNTYMEE
jgi:hypothetical protein